MHSSALRSPEPDPTLGARQPRAGGEGPWDERPPTGRAGASKKVPGRSRGPFHLYILVEVASDLSNRGRHYENALRRLVETMQVYLCQRIGFDSNNNHRATIAKSRRLSKRLTNDQITSISSKYREGASSADLAAQYGVSKTSIVEILRQQNVPVRDRRLKPEIQKLAISLYIDGNSLATVGKRVNASPTSVRKLLIREGIARRN